MGPVVQARAGIFRGRLLAAAVAALALAVPVAARAAPGDLDRSFSGDGRLITPIGSDTRGTAVAVQPDGRIVAAGTFDYGQKVGLVRYLRNGALDSSFGDGAIQGFDFGDGTYVWISDVGLDSQGQIVVVGTVQAPQGDDYSGDVAIARLTPAGQLDTTFSGDGRKLIDLGGDDSVAGVAVLPDDRVLVGAFEYEPGGDFAVVRLTEGGGLDTSFSGDGRQTVNFGGKDIASTIALDRRGRIVLAGTRISQRSDYRRDAALARLLPTGARDRSFSGDGRRLMDLGGDGDIASVAAQRGGKIVVAGVTIQVRRGRLHREDIILARFKESGALDRRFSRDGIKRTDMRRYDEASKVIVQRDRKLVVAANTTDFSLDYGFDWVVLRYTRRGKLDRSFSRNGRTVLHVGGGIAADMAIQPDGRILEIGWSWEDDADTDGYGFELARFTNDGLPS
jgi:uncharacterized delta-60 repeat protein